jgi:hypothetical protein
MKVPEDDTDSETFHPIGTDTSQEKRMTAIVVEDYSLADQTAAPSDSVINIDSGDEKSDDDSPLQESVAVTDSSLAENTQTSMEIEPVDTTTTSCNTFGSPPSSNANGISFAIAASSTP